VTSLDALTGAVTSGFPASVGGLVHSPAAPPGAAASAVYLVSGGDLVSLGLDGAARWRLPVCVGSAFGPPATGPAGFVAVSCDSFIAFVSDAGASATITRQQAVGWDFARPLYVTPSSVFGTSDNSGGLVLRIAR